MRKQREDIIKNYINGYNNAITKKMTSGFHEEVVFRNIRSEIARLTLHGIEAFRQQAASVPAFLANRKQEIKAIKHAEDYTEVRIRYSAVLNTDLPNGLNKVALPESDGTSVFKFSDNKIIALTDIS